MGKDVIQAYQMVQTSQIMQYAPEDVPEARFSYDISPMAVVIKKKGTWRRTTLVNSSHHITSFDNYNLLYWPNLI